MRETARDHTPMTALPYYHVAARAVPAITATPCGGYPPEKRLTDTLSVVWVGLYVPWWGWGGYPEGASSRPNRVGLNLPSDLFHRRWGGAF